MPASEPDPDFVIDPDGGMPRSKANADRDEDGDVAIYQGQDDNVPCAVVERCLPVFARRASAARSCAALRHLRHVHASPKQSCTAPANASKKSLKIARGI